eukprot:SAG31_NODE_5422_length_2547_cov_2.691585_2_plen_407_part_01
MITGAFLAAGGQIPYECPPCLRPEGGLCAESFYTIANTCHLCPDSADLTQYLQPGAMSVATLVGLYVFWIHMGRDSKKLANAKDILVLIQFGLCATAVEVAESLQQQLVAHLECELDWVHIQDSTSAHVVESPAQTPAHLFVLTDEWVARPECVPLIVLSLAARAGMDLSNLTDTDIHKNLLAMPHDKLSALRKGSFLVIVSSEKKEKKSFDRKTIKKKTKKKKKKTTTVTTTKKKEEEEDDDDERPGTQPASDSGNIKGTAMRNKSFDSSGVLDSEAYKQLTDHVTGLGFPPAIIYDPGTTAATLHAPISAFLDEERLDAAYKQLAKAFVVAAKDTSLVIRDLVAERERFVRGARTVGRASSMLRIQLPHIQIISWSWSLNVSWPAFVLVLRDEIGAFFLLDLTTA